jgi:hypothetical protein
VRVSLFPRAGGEQRICSVYLLYWYKSANTDAEGAEQHMSAVLEDLALQIVEPWGSDGMEEGARSTLRHSSARCSVYLLYWYKSTK